MWLSPDPTRFSSQFKYIELGRYSASANKVFREKERTFEWSDVEVYRKKHNNLGIYTSVFYYNSRDFGAASRLASLYFDLDSKNNLEAQRETLELVTYLRKYVPESAIRIYFTGLKGFHVECEALTLGVSASPKLADVFRYIAKEITDHIGLTTVDFQCYDARRMWRLPNSQHQKSGLYKVGISYDQLCDSIESIQDFAKQPHWDYEVPPQEFDAQANEWYREFTYNFAVKSEAPMDRIKRFEQFGTGIIVDTHQDSDKEFDPERLFTNCPSILNLWRQAEQNQHLSHEARLFLCSILTYSEDAEEYLYQILSNCSDFNEGKTRAHVEDWKRRRELGLGGRPLTCSKAREWGVGCTDCDLEPKEKYTYENGSLIKTGEYSEPSPYRFAYSKKTKNPLL